MHCSKSSNFKKETILKSNTDQSLCSLFIIYKFMICSSSFHKFPKMLPIRTKPITAGDASLPNYLTAKFVDLGHNFTNTVCSKQF